MNVNGKYIKDENGIMISPVTSTDSVFINNTVLTSKLKLKQLFSGDVGGLDSLTMTDNYSSGLLQVYSVVIIKSIYKQSMLFCKILLDELIKGV